MAGNSGRRLKREVGWFGAFSMGFGDVGADIFIALGVTALYAGGGVFLAFLITAIAYLAVSLSYAELAPTYPYAGGVYVYALRAWNTLASFIAGWAIILDYVLCTALFATTASGYFKYVFTELEGLEFSLGPVSISSLALIAAAIVLLLIAVNYVGIKYSAGLLVGIVAVGIAVQSLILAVGFLTSFDPSRFLSQLRELGNTQVLGEVGYIPGISVETNNFLYALTIAMASYIGVESIAQAAEEVRRPYRWIPRAAVLCAFSVPTFVLLFSALGLGVTGWQVLADSIENPVAALVSRFPVLGAELSLLVALTAIVLATASSNTGLIGISRLAASMGRLGLLPGWLYSIHPRFRTPTRTIIIFGLVALLLTLSGNIPLLASLYNFGASLSYIILLLALLKLRNSEPHVYRPWRMRPSVRLMLRGKPYEVPVLALVGLILIGTIFTLFMLLHPYGRVLGVLWMLSGLAGYYLYKRLVARAPVVSREERAAVIPAGYRMRLTVLVRPYEDPETVVQSLKHYFDRRFSIKLLSIIDPELEPEYERAAREAEASLNRVSESLASSGYDVSVEVRVGQLEQLVELETRRGDSDFIVLLVKRFLKGAIEKVSLADERFRSVLSRHPAKAILIRKVGPEE
jgi:APA family basic amino acid/polyamine antiporter